MIRTFLDAGVLIALARANPKQVRETVVSLEDTARLFVSSPYVRLEVMPKALFHQQSLESHFYETFFSLGVTDWCQDNAGTVEKAFELAQEYGLSAMDALHAAAALLTQCEEFITTEKPGKPLYRLSPLIRVRFLYD